ncbi:MAG: MFS transporter, partial [Chloroflexota bacterium]|nr:MFS transporter [Chloroflexota bacterium]
MPSLTPFALRGVFYGWWIVLAVTLVITIGNGLANFTFGLFVVPMAADLGVSRGLIGWLPTARLVGNSAMSVVLGPLVDRHGARWLLALAAVITAVVLLAVSRAPSYAIVLALFFVLGAFDFSTPGHVLTAVPVAKWFVRNRGRAIGYIGIGIAAGGIFYSFFHQYLIDNVGWRSALAVSAVIIAVTVIPLSLLLLRRQPEDMGLEPDGAPPGRAPGAPTWSGEVQWTRAEAIRTSAFPKLVAAYLLANFAVSGFLVHRAGMWTDGGLSGAVIATAFALDSLAFGFGAVGTGYLIGRIPSRFIAAGAALLQAATIAVIVAWVNAP